MKVFRNQGVYLFVLRRGEKLISTLTETATKEGIKGGSFSGVGAATEVELGFYSLPEKKYFRKIFDEEYELISLSGNLTLKDEQPYLHAHTLIGDSQFHTFGGHLFEATVSVTAEVTLTPFGKMPVRKFDPQIGIGLICGFENNGSGEKE